MGKYENSKVRSMQGGINMKERYKIWILRTNGDEEDIFCSTLKEVMVELLHLARKTNIQEVEAIDTFRKNDYGGPAQITD